jgi:hypothetical protein
MVGTDEVRGWVGKSYPGSDLKDADNGRFDNQTGFLIRRRPI